MNDKAKQVADMDILYDLCSDFTLLNNREKRKIIRNAKDYWKLLRDNNALFTDQVPAKTGK